MNCPESGSEARTGKRHGLAQATEFVDETHFARLRGGPHPTLGDFFYLLDRHPAAGGNSLDEEFVDLIDQNLHASLGPLG